MGCGRLIANARDNKKQQNKTQFPEECCFPPEIQTLKLSCRIKLTGILLDILRHSWMSVRKKI